MERAGDRYSRSLAVAGLRIALQSLRRADDVVRSRNRPEGALRGVTAYLAGFAGIRTMATVVDRKRTAFWSFLACLALALLSVAQSAAPVVPFAVAAAIMLIRSISALAFIATESTTTRRFALIPARAGAADRTYFMTALVLAALVIAPLMAGGLIRMAQSSR